MLGPGEAVSVFNSQPELLAHVKSAELCVTSETSWLSSLLREALDMRNTINIHAGVLPYYRGSSSNFWCIADERLELVGVTVYSLIVGVDSGPILFHSTPRALSCDPFEFGMEAVKGFHLALVNHIMSRTLFGLCAENQDRSKTTPTLEFRRASGCLLPQSTSI